MLVPLFLLKIFVVIELQARNFKVEMLERGIPFDAGIVSPVPKNGGTRYSLLCTSDFPERPGFFMPLMSTAADPLGPGLSGPLPRTLPRRRQGGYVFGGISRGAAPCPKWRGCVLRFETYSGRSRFHIGFAF